MVNQKDERNSKISFELEKSQVVLFSTFASFEHSTFMQFFTRQGWFLRFSFEISRGKLRARLARIDPRAHAQRCIQSAISKLNITLAALPIRIPMEYHLWKTEYAIHFILDLMKYLANVILIIRILAKQQLWIWPRNLLRLFLLIHITWQSIYYVTCWWIDIDRQLWIMDQTFEWSCSLFKATYNVEESNLKFLRRIYTRVIRNVAWNLTPGSPRSQVIIGRGGRCGGFFLGGSHGF